MKHTPATPLPWTARGLTVQSDLLICEVEDHVHVAYDNSRDAPQNAAYIAHAANAYPRLVEALRHIVHPDMDAFHNLTGSHAAHCNALLRELGEDA